jgi:Na+-driven multidrug efflux pump/anti-sigma regulatory factor (Ser/Thr protein kinase)
MSTAFQPGHNRSIIRNTFYIQLLAFIMLSLSSSVGSMVDGIVIGQFLGVDSIAAFGIINPLMIAFSIIGAVVSAGARNRFTSLLGAGKTEQARQVFSLACALSTGFAAALMLFLIIFSGPVTSALGASRNTAGLLPLARDYLIGISFGLPAMNLVRVLNGFMPLDNDRNLPVISSIFLTVSDIVMDLAAVLFFHGNTLEMGIATSISYYVALAVLLTHFRKKDIFLRFQFRRLPWKEIAAILGRGMPSGVCRLGNTLRCIFMNRMLALIASSAAIAAYSVHRQADSFFNPVTIGMADTVALLAGILVGEEDRPMMKRLLFTSVQATLVITAGIAALIWLFAPGFASLYIKDNPEALRLAVTAVRCYAIGMPLNGLNLIYLNYFQGIGKSLLASVSGFICESGLLILSAAAMMPLLGAEAVWWAFPVSQFLVMCYYGVVVAMESRRIKIHREGLFNRVLLLPDTFDVPDRNKLDVTITGMEDVMQLTDKVWDFCELHSCDSNIKTKLVLSVEEMAGNVIHHGFADGKAHCIEVRILKKGDGYYARFRDDCLIFDPIRQIKLLSDEDPTHHIGLRMISAIAKDIQYTCVLKLNNILVKI